jgi:hypothetical protein
MRRLTWILALLLVSASTSNGEACGDKFLRVGRGARYQRAYVAVHPAKLLLLARPGSTVAAALNELEPTLKRAGHKPVVVKDPAVLPEALGRGHFNIVLGDIRDVPSIEKAARASGVRVDVLPFLEEPTPQTLASAEGDYHCVAEVPGKKADVLGKIDEIMEFALKGTGETNRKVP